MGVAQNGWFIREKPNLKWILGVTPILGNPQEYGLEKSDGFIGS